MRAKVVAVSDGRFRYDGPMYQGLEGCLGDAAQIEQDGLHVILVNQREQPYDSALARSLGLDVRQMRYIGLKSSGHFRAAFEPMAGTLIGGFRDKAGNNTTVNDTTTESSIHF